MSGFVSGDEFIEFMEDAEYTLILTYAKVGEPDDRRPDWDPYSRTKMEFRYAGPAWWEYLTNEAKVGHSLLVCASLRRNGELIAMKAVKGA